MYPANASVVDACVPPQCLRHSCLNAANSQEHRFAAGVVLMNASTNDDKSGQRCFRVEFNAMGQADLVKDGGHQYFIKYLEGAEPGISADSRAQAAFVLAVICDGYPRGRMLCAEQGLLPKLLSLLATMVRS